MVERVDFHHIPTMFDLALRQDFGIGAEMAFALCFSVAVVLLNVTHIYGDTINLHLIVIILYLCGRVAKWLERLAAVRNIDGSSRTLGS